MLVLDSSSSSMTCLRGEGEGVSKRAYIHETENSNLYNQELMVKLIPSARERERRERGRQTESLFCSLLLLLSGFKILANANGQEVKGRPDFTFVKNRNFKKKNKNKKTSCF